MAATKKKAGVSRQMVLRAKRRRRTQTSSIELLVQDWLKSAEIPFKKQYAIGLCHVDLFIEPKLVIEIQGCYYHACPQCRPSKTVHNKKAKAKDHKRFKFLLTRGYKLMLLWEHELKEEHEEEVIEKIREKMAA
jgi:very-short-patch-repair endonuclease